MISGDRNFRNGTGRGRGPALSQEELLLRDPRELEAQEEELPGFAPVVASCGAGAVRSRCDS